MLVLSAIPHHHHHHNDGSPCFKNDLIEHTAQNCAENHEHEHNLNKNQSSDNNHESSNCILHANFIFQQSDSNLRNKSNSINSDDNKAFKAFNTIFVSENLNIILPVKRELICEYINSLFSTDTTTPLGLRAPPSDLA